MKRVLDEKGRPYWAVRHKLQAAFDLKKSRQKEDSNAIFAEEFSGTGQRRWILTNRKYFWQLYEQIPPKHKHHYEIIEEGVPAKLYFDLEFAKRWNTAANGARMMNILKVELIAFCHVKHAIHVTFADLVDLDSTTLDKFSRHIIVNFADNVCFDNNLSVGVFVKQFCSWLQQKAHDDDVKQLFISTGPSGERKLFIDLTVYSRNRCFRLLFSSKFLKSSYLTFTAGQARFVSKKPVTPLDRYHAFADTLVTAVTVDADTRVIKLNVPPRPRLSSRVSSVITFEVAAAKVVCHDTRLDGANAWVSRVVHRWGRQTAPWTDEMSQEPTDVTSDSHLWDADLNSGKISKIKSYLAADGGLQNVLYFVNGNRFCMNVRRQHKSNSIWFILECGNS